MYRKRKFIIFLKIFIFFFITGVLLSAMVFFCLQSADAVPAIPKQGLWHRVSRRETIWDIARLYDTSMDAIISANKISNPKRIKPGTKLFIPGIAPISKEDDGTWHRVERGETLSHIAQRYGVRWRDIFRANKLISTRRLHIGKRLFIPNVKSKDNGIFHTVRRGDTVWDIARKYRISQKNIIRANRLTRAKSIRPGTRLFIPGVKRVTERTRTSYSGFTCPLKGKIHITSRYGWRIHPVRRRRLYHHGIDLRAGVGSGVYAAMSGKVIYAGRYGGYGRLVIIQHRGGLTTRYGHLLRAKVRVGQKVKRGQLIALSGNSGVSTGPHLHFEVRKEGKTHNPANYISAFKS